MKEIDKTNCEDFVKPILHEFVQDRNYLRGCIDLLILLYEGNKMKDTEEIKNMIKTKLEQMKFLEDEMRDWINHKTIK